MRLQYPSTSYGKKDYNEQKPALNMSALVRDESRRYFI